MHPTPTPSRSTTAEVPRPGQPGTPAVPEAPVTPAVPDPGTPADPEEPATVPPAEEPATLAAWEAFHRQVEALPEEEREVFDLVWYQGLKHTEAAALLGVSAAQISLLINTQIASTMQTGTVSQQA